MDSLSKEEKEAIIKVRKLLFMFPESKELEILLNLIEKLQKENEELKEKEKNLLLQLKDSEKELLEVTQNIVSKDKIRDIIEKSYNDIDYFNRDMRKDFEDLLKKKK